MRRLVLKMSVSVDGFVSGPSGEVDWVFRSMDAGASEWIVATLWEAGLHLMGRRTFEDMVAWWPTSIEPYAAPMNQIPKVVFSRGGPPGRGTTTTALRDATAARGGGGAASDAAAEIAKRWRESPVITGPLADAISRLKRQPGKDLLAHGGASFARGLAAAGLIDEYRLLVHPAVLGRGLPLFADLPAPLELELVETRAFAGGAVANVYRPRRTA